MNGDRAALLPMLAALDASPRTLRPDVWRGEGERDD